jgi:acetyl-CoA carboxylase biotin carboxyl carrier protein
MDGNEMNELAELVEFLKANGIAEFEREREGNKLRIRFAGEERDGASGLDMGRLGQLLAVQGAASAAPAAPAAEAPAADPTGHLVKSPIVGTFYESPSPGSPPFVKVGDRVEAGQVLCIVEAMKLMNEIESDVAGEVVRMIGVSGQPVEYGQPLFEIRQ